MAYVMVKGHTHHFKSHLWVAYTVRCRSSFYGEHDWLQDAACFRKLHRLDAGGAPVDSLPVRLVKQWAPCLVFYAFAGTVVTVGYNLIF